MASWRRGVLVRLLGLALAAALAALAVTILPVVALRWIDPPTSAFMLRERFAGVGTVRWSWVDWEDVAPAMALAVVAAEDQKFPLHSGFDLESITRAVEESRRGRRMRGASTISQQTAKNLFLWPGRSWLRKGLEVWFTLLLERLWPKRRILEVYLNVAEFGEGIYGVGAAAGVFYAKPASALTTGEAARLAAVLPSPKRMRVESPTEADRRRAHWIERQMAQLGAGYLRDL